MDKGSGKEVMTNARELPMGKMSHFCEAEGIKISTTIPYHPALNGVAEHTLGVLTSSMHVKLAESGLLKSLWAEAYNTAMYIPNRMITSALDGCTPYNIVYSVKPDLTDLCTFGTPCSQWRS